MYKNESVNKQITEITEVWSSGKKQNWYSSVKALKNHIDGIRTCSVTQWCPTLYDRMSCSPPGSSVLDISQAKILEWVAISSSRESSWPRGQTHVSCISCIDSQIPFHWVTWEARSWWHIALKGMKILFKTKIVIFIENYFFWQPTNQRIKSIKGEHQVYTQL